MQLMLRHTIGGAIAIRTELDPEAGRALCDENQLENAILNLAINARDAMPDGGTLTISTSLVERAARARPRRPATMSRIAVADTGQGMPPGRRRARRRALLLDQAARQGHRPRPRPGLRHRPPVGRHAADRQRARARARPSGCCCRTSRRAAADGPAARRTRERRPRAGRRRRADPRGRRRRRTSAPSSPTSLVSLGHRVETLRRRRGRARGAGRDGAPDLAADRFRHAGDERRRARPRRSASAIPTCRSSSSPALPRATSSKARSAATSPVLRKPFGIDELAAVVESHVRPRRKGLLNRRRPS